MVWQGGLSFPASWSFTDAAHTCATLHSTGRQMLSLLGQVAPPGAQKKFMVLCTSLSSSWSPGRCLPHFQLWHFSAEGPKVLSWLAKPCHLCPTERGISSSLPSPRSTPAVAQPSEAGVCLCRGYLLWLQGGASSRAGAEPQLQGFTHSTAFLCLLLR